MNDYKTASCWKVIYNEFPSPTGVTYYESKLELDEYGYVDCNGFRPLQGLPIMNHLHLLVPTVSQSSMVSVPYRGYLL